MNGKRGSFCDGYVCPACGGSTCVKSTVPYETHITRKRECLVCGKTHETIEMRVDFYAVLMSAHQQTKAFEERRYAANQ